MITENEEDGVWGSCLQPSQGLFWYRVPDSELLTEVCRVYNDWIVPFAKACPGTVRWNLEPIHLTEINFERIINEINYWDGFLERFLICHGYSRQSWKHLRASWLGVRARSTLRSGRVSLVRRAMRASVIVAPTSKLALLSCGRSGDCLINRLRYPPCSARRDRRPLRKRSLSVSTLWMRQKPQAMPLQ
jgi:hypothetical protein